MSAPFPKHLWLVLMDKPSMIGQIVSAPTYRWRDFDELRILVNRFNRDKKSPAIVAGPFYTQDDAERFMRAHHTQLRRRVRRASDNPSR